MRSFSFSGVPRDVENRVHDNSPLPGPWRTREGICGVKPRFM